MTMYSSYDETNAPSSAVLPEAKEEVPAELRGLIYDCVTFGAPYLFDNSSNTWGDYDLLVCRKWRMRLDGCVVQSGVGWELADSKGRHMPKVLTDGETRLALETVFLNNRTINNYDSHPLFGSFAVPETHHRSNPGGAPARCPPGGAGPQGQSGLGSKS